MRRFVALLIILATLATTVSVWAEDWTLANGKTYKNITIIAQEGDGVRVSYDGGVGKFPYYELPDDVLLRLGQDPASMAIKRAAMMKQEAADALQAQQDAAAAAELKKQQAEQAAINAALNPTQPQSTNSAPANSPASNSPAANSAPASGPSQPQNPSPSPKPSATANAAPAPAPAPGPVAPPAPPPIVFPPPATANSADNPEVQQQQSSYPNSKFQYDDRADVSYLDSPMITIVPIVVEASPTAASAPPNATLYLRVITEGERAESPDEVEGVFTSPVPLKYPSTSKVVFLVDGAFVPTTPPIESTDASSDAPSNMQVTFFLTPEHLKTLLSGKKVNVNVAGGDYQIDESSLATFKSFLGDVDHLPPASTSFVRTYHHIVNELPSIITMISTSCEYIILGAFALVMVAAIAAFVMGLTRFIKM